MKEIILSPFRNCEAHLKRVPDTMEFRGKTYHFLNHYYVCDESGEEFTDEATGEVNFAQVYNQYREENNIPFVNEIIKLREDCHLSKADMGRILGFGENQYYHYELGEVPSPSNGRLMRTLIDNREALMSAIRESSIKNSNKEKALRALEKLSLVESEESMISKLIFPVKRSIYNGYALTSVNKVRQMILYFLERMNVGYKTALNKLMFYADFLMFKEYGVGISGLTYSALPYGNVPNHFKVLYGVFDEVEEVDDEKPYFKPLSVCDMNVFNDNEIKVLEYVADKLARQASTALSEKNHQEDAWLKYKHDTKLLVPFSEAFSLKALAF
jgi:putative zinc finger/helix-turn-helix YgiT family protein